MRLFNSLFHKTLSPLKRHPRFVVSFALFGLALFAFFPWAFCGRIAPWDFQGVSAVGPVFVSESIASGNWPTWSSFVGGGIPLSSFLGAELFFPLWWVTGILDFPLTLNTLAKIQILFVVGGSLGYVALFRARSIGWRWAFAAGVAFTFFGGNFAEASHSGAVRGFALVPWLLWSLTAPQKGESWRRLLWTPIWVWFLASGIYPAFLPTLAILGSLYLIIELFQNREQISRKLVTILGFSALSSALITLASWSIYLSHDSAGLLYRPHPPTVQIRSGTSIQAFDIFGLFLDPWALRSDGTIHSWGVGIPILLGLGGVTSLLVKKHASIAVVGIGALFLAVIPQYEPIGRLMVDQLSFLFPTRFVAMDVKSIAALAIIFFSVLGWREILERELDRRVAVRAITVFLIWLVWFAWGYVERDPTPSLRMLLLVLTLTLSLVEVAFRKPALSKNLLVVALLFLIVAEGVRTTAIMYHNNGTHAWHGEMSSDDPRNAAAASLDELLNNPPAQRPARIPPSVDPQKRAHGTPRDGTGLIGLGYNVSNYGGYMTTAYWEMVNDPASLERFLLPWTPWTIDCLHPDCSDISTLGALETWTESSQILTTRYGQESIDYKVNFDTPVIFIENEINFPGWTSSDERVTSFEHTGSFRAWRVEAGTYNFTASYQSSEARKQLISFSIGILLWAFSVGWWLKKERLLRAKKNLYLNSKTGQA